MAKLILFRKVSSETVGPDEFVYISSSGDSEEVQADFPGYELYTFIELDDWEVGDFPTDRVLSP